jgi:hypothetical protein
MNGYSLLGLLYPITEAGTNNIIGYKTITSVSMINNYAFFLIGLDNATQPSILIPLHKIDDFIKNQPKDAIILDTVEDFK